MKILTVYFSLTGNSKMLAESIANATGSDIIFLKTEEPLPHIDPNKNSKYFWGGFYAKVGKKPPLKPLPYDPEDYDMIFLACPIWSWTVNPVMRSFLSTYDLTGKKVAICLSSLGAPSPKAIKRYKKTLEEGIELLDVIEFKEPLSNDPEAAKQRVSAWAEQFIQ